ncbi:MAG: hypothetical protein KY475_00915 [Planctomycetes bacterium]|nr:hypothetical protein [Planctomycetota bacterium]
MTSPTKVQTMTPSGCPIARITLTGVVWLCVCNVFAFAQDQDDLPNWTPDQSVVARLGDEFSDSRISIRPPSNLKQADRRNPPEMQKIGVYQYGWTPGGEFPSTENLSIGLTPFAQPSSAALDKTIEGMKESLQEGLPGIEFGDVRKGQFRGQEARAGQYTAPVSGDESIIAFYLVGIDERGSFAVTAMAPQSKASPERIQELKSSILTFRRVK